MVRLGWAEFGGRRREVGTVSGSGGAGYGEGKIFYVCVTRGRAPWSLRATPGSTSRRLTPTGRFSGVARVLTWYRCNRACLRWCRVFGTPVKNGLDLLRSQGALFEDSDPRTVTARDRAREFVRALACIRFENVFNPYADECPICDLAEAAMVRRRNLELVLTAALSAAVDSIWIARDLGYRGGRRTGLALTDDVHLCCHSELFGTPPLARATTGPAVAERTAAVIWRSLRLISRPVFLWNVFPLHPHEPNEPMSNRCHTRAERDGCTPLLLWLLQALNSKDIVAIGRDSQAALASLGVHAINVRHPSFGGQTQFLTDLAAHYGVSLDRGIAPRID
jgi:hypothetical protein